MDEKGFDRRIGASVTAVLVAIWARVVNVSDDDRGATATEYAILVAFIALLIILGVTFFGGELNNFFGNIGNHVKTMNS